MASVTDDPDRLRRLALTENDLDAARRLLQLASRRGDVATVTELRRAVPELRWAGCTDLRTNAQGCREFLHRKSDLVLVEIPRGTVVVPGSLWARTRVVCPSSDVESTVESFLIGQVPLSQASIWRFVEHPAAANVPDLHPSGRRSNRPEPAELRSPACLGWSLARAYCDWAGLRLPSVEEWLRAADVPRAPAPAREIRRRLRVEPLWQPDPEAPLEAELAAAVASRYGVLACGLERWEWLASREAEQPTPLAICGGVIGERGDNVVQLADRGLSGVTLRVAFTCEPSELDRDETDDRDDALAFRARIVSELGSLAARLRPRPLGLDAIAPMRAEAAARIDARQALARTLPGIEDWRSRLEAGAVKLGLELDEALSKVARDDHESLREDLRHLDPSALAWHLPRDERGRVALREEIVLTAYAGMTRMRRGDGMALLARTPLRRGDAQVVTLAVEKVRLSHRSERWDLERWRWDGRMTSTPLAERWGIAGLDLERLSLERRDLEIDRLSAIASPDDAERAALGILLQDAGRLEEALALYEVEVSDEMLLLLRGEPTPDVPLAQQEAWTRHAQATVQVCALWRLAALSREKGAHWITRLPHQTTVRKTSIELVGTRSGRARLELTTTGSEQRVPRNLWKRPREIDLQRFGLLEWGAALRSP